MEGSGREMIPAGNLADAELEDSVDFSIVYVGVAGSTDVERMHRTTPPGPSLLLAAKTISGLPGVTWRSWLTVTKGQGEIWCGVPPRKSTRYRTFRPPLNAANTAVFPEASTIA